MYRSLILSQTVVALALVALTGCPTVIPQNVDTTQPVRLSINTTAESDVDTVATVGQNVTLSATANLDRGAVSYSWVQTGGSGVALFDADRRESGFVAHSLEEQQTLSFSVTTRNDRGDVGRADVTVAVAADPDFETSGEVGEGPSARAGGDRTVEGGIDVTLSGSASTGSQLSYSWKQVSGKFQVSLSGAETVRSTFTAPAFVAGSTNEYGFELTVSDDQKRSSRDTVTIRIRDLGGSNNETGGSEPGAKPRVRFETTVGEFVIEVEPDLVPETVANFLRYVRDDFYIGLIFHRALPDFVVQGGGFTPRMARAETRDPIDLEVSGLSNTRTSVGMARLVDPDSATSQFYVNVVDNSEELDPSATNDGYSVFGHVVEGMAVIDAIANVRTANRGLPPDQFFDVPVVDIIINAVTIE